MPGVELKLADIPFGKRLADHKVGQRFILRANERAGLKIFSHDGRNPNMAAVHRVNSIANQANQSGNARPVLVRRRGKADRNKGRAHQCRK